MEWVKEQIIPELSDDVKFTFVDANDNDTGYIDLYLISKCKHTISSNSSFGYYGGLLNENLEKVVIIPNKWVLADEEYLVGHETAHEVPGWIILPYRE